MKVAIERISKFLKICPTLKVAMEIIGEFDLRKTFSEGINFLLSFS